MFYKQSLKKESCFYLIISSMYCLGIALTINLYQLISTYIKDANQPVLKINCTYKA